MKKTTLRKIIVFVLCFCFLASSFSTVGAAKAKIKLSKTKLSICIDESYRLKVSGATSATWKSSNKKIATVSKNGTVKGIKNGSAKITARVKGKNYTCKVTVKKISLNRTTVNLSKGQSTTLTVNNAYKKAKITWKSSNTKVATVSKTGTVKGIKVGTATITCTVNKSKYTCKIAVSGRDTALEQYFIKWLSTVNTNNTNESSCYQITCPEHITYLNGITEKWINGTYSTSKAKSLMQSKKFEYTRSGTYRVKSLGKDITFYKKTFKNNVSKEDILHDIYYTDFSSRHYLYVKVINQGSTKTVYVVNGNIQDYKSDKNPAWMNLDW